MFSMGLVFVMVYAALAQDHCVTETNGITNEEQTAPVLQDSVSINDTVCRVEPKDDFDDPCARHRMWFCGQKVVVCDVDLPPIVEVGWGRVSVHRTGACRGAALLRTTVLCCSYDVKQQRHFSYIQYPTGIPKNKTNNKHTF